MRHHREREEETRIYSKEEAFQVAKEMAKADIKSRLPEDAIIKGEKVLRQSIDNGKVTDINTFPNNRKYWQKDNQLFKESRNDRRFKNDKCSAEKFQ